MDSIELAKFSWLLEEEQKRGAPQYKFKELLIDIIIDWLQYKEAHILLAGEQQIALVTLCSVTFLSVTFGWLFEEEQNICELIGWLWRGTKYLWIYWLM